MSEINKSSELANTDKSKLPGLVNASDADVLEYILANKDSLIPWEDCTLPSAGYFYGGRVPGGHVQVKAFGMQVEKIMATQRLVHSGKLFDYIFKESVKFSDDSMEPSELLNGDAMFLLFYLRGITHGPEYEFLIKCSNTDCKKQFPQSIDLNRLAATVKVADGSYGEEPFRVVLPYLTKVIGKEVYVNIRLLRLKDLRAIAKREKMAQYVGEEETIDVDQMISRNLELIIKDVNGNSSPLKIRQFVETLHEKDSDVIQGFLRDVSPGLEPRVEINCPECNEDMKVAVPLQESFFRPAQARGTRT